MMSVTFEQYIKAVDDFRRGYCDFLTNTFIHLKEIARQLARKKILFAKKEDAVLLGIFYHDKYYAIYYYASGQTALIRGLRNIKARNAEKIPFCLRNNRERNRSPFARASVHGQWFIVRRRLRQINNMGKDYDALGCLQETTADFSNENSILQIMRLFFDYFDIYSDRIPEKRELFDYIANEQAVVIRRDDLAVAFLIFETARKTYHGKYMCVDREYRSSLLYYEFDPFLAGIFKKGLV
jgi:hypothetical protein